MAKVRTGVPTGGLRVLVVDDDHDFTDSLAKLLTAWGHDVCAAYDGQSAVEQARIWRPHVALLDIRMPNMDGFQVAECLRRQSESQATVLVAITGWNAQEARRRATSCGFSYYLLKPVNPNGLRHLLTALRANLFLNPRSSRKDKTTSKLPLPHINGAR
jgi:CheY-like chemotaxis protein